MNPLGHAVDWTAAERERVAEWIGDLAALVLDESNHGLGHPWWKSDPDAPEVAWIPYHWRSEEIRHLLDLLHALQSALRSIPNDASATTPR